jgi:hypothetical protein
MPFPAEGKIVVEAFEPSFSNWFELVSFKPFPAKRFRPGFLKR